MPKDKTSLTKSTPDKYFIDYGTKINYSKIPRHLRDIIGYDEIEATAGLALVMCKLQGKPLLEQRRHMTQAVIWKTAELLKIQRHTRLKTSKARKVCQSPSMGDDDPSDFFDQIEAPDSRDTLAVLDGVEGLTLSEYAWLYHRYIAGCSRSETVALMGLNTYTTQTVSVGARKKMRAALNHTEL